MPHKDPEARKAYELTYYQKNREKRIKRARAHQVAHKENRAAYLTQYAAEHREALREYHREWSAKNKDKIRGYAAARAAQEKAKKAQKYQENLVEEREKRRAYYRANVSKMVENVHRRRARKAKAAINDFTHAQWVAMQEAYDHRCAYCETPAKGHLTQDHLMPIIKGGNHTMRNIVPACRSCNGRKGTGKVLTPVQPLLLLIL